MKFIESHSFDPYYNLSFEEYIFKMLPIEDETSYVSLWQNSPAVIIGRNQNARAEINEDYLEQNNVALVRRITGGGAVYHDLGNINFSFVGRGDKIDFKSYYKPIVAALRRMGLPAELSGRNDVTIEGKKVIGASQAVWKGRILSNGCILYDVALGHLAQALKPREIKLKSKGVKSVRARVANISEFLIARAHREAAEREFEVRGISTADVGSFKRLLLQEIFKEFGQEPVEYVLNDEDRTKILQIKNSRFGLDSWNWGAELKRTHHAEARMDCGLVEIYFDLKDGRMRSVKICGDFFGTGDVKEVEGALEGEEPSIDAVREAILSKGLDLREFLGAAADMDSFCSLVQDAR